MDTGAGHAGPGRAYRRDIDGLRAVAILVVVLFHAGIPFIPGGFVGVDVFFVISGFLIAGIIRGELDAGTFSLARFYERRARRILPALFVMIAVAIVAGWAILLPEAFGRLAISAVATVFSVSNLWFWREANDYFGGDAADAPLLHTWSLGVEEQFYLLVPLVILAAFRWRRSALPRLAVATVAVLLVAGVAVAWARPAVGFYWTPFRAWELGIGVVLALAPPPIVRTPSLNEALAAAGLVAILVAAFLYSESTPWPGLAALLPTLGAAALIHAGNSGPTLTGRVLSLGPLVAIGLISYSLYLWHWPILVFLQQLLSAQVLTTTETLAAIAASFVVAALSWRFIERPFRRRSWLSRRQVLRSSLAGAGVIVVVAIAVVAGRGLPDRFSAEEQPLVAFLERETEGGPCTFGAFEDPACRFGAAAEPTVLLWGDSHSRAISPAIGDAAVKAGVAGIRVWSPACPPLYGVIQSVREDCLGFNDGVLARLRQHPEIDTVLLSARWAYWELDVDRTYDRNTGTGKPIHLDDPAIPGAPGLEGGFVFGLRSLLDLLVAEGYAVVVIGTTPEFRFSVPEALLTELRWGIRQTFTDAAAYAGRNARVRPLLEELGRRPGVRFVPIDDVLCPDACVVQIDGQPVYRDTDHLTAVGATTLLADVLAARIWDVPTP
jgi:peptidoglycan/LPS O-acetylase OafA/YrhL